MSSRFLPRRQHQPAGAVFAVLAQLLLLEHAEGFAGEIRSLTARGVALWVERVAHFFPGVEEVFQFARGQVGGVEDVAQLLAGEAVQAGVVGVQFGAQVGAAFFVPGEGREGRKVRG